jgi:hypothetical protein
VRRTGSIRLALAVATVALASGIAAAPAHGARTSAEFVSPSGNIGCQMATTFVICLLMNPPFHKATLNRRGHTAICNGPACAGDLGEGSHGVLHYGHSIRVGGFRCTSRTTGMTCRVVKTGKGFRLNRTGVKRVA